MRNFNTSYVTVQLYIFEYYRYVSFRFQYILCYGSTVTIKTGIASAEFQYILCYGSTRTSPVTTSVGFNISIHPMLRFNDISTWNSLPLNQISIHPMLRFNSILRKKDERIYYISIHPMLRFNFSGHFLFYI